ncbi:MAG TPA: MATE family efflux transporter [Candidatus Fournierella excrementigallinarum]|nr:MATE family efflux transporter [Candidatus Fournierella excrementigallinarum]
MAGSYEMNMTSGPLLGKILTFSFPLMCSGVLQLLFNAADIIVVGRYTGHTALAAVGSTSSLINLIVNLFVGLSVGANVLIARNYGAKNMDAVHKGVHTAMLTAVVGGVFLIFVGVAASRPMLSLMGTPDDVIDQAALYLRIYFVGAPSLLVYNFGAAILRAVGDTRRPLYFLTLAGIINVVLNLVFVIVFSLGVAGVALATIISQTVSAYLVVVCLQHNTGAFRLVLHELRIDPAQFREILRIGVPAGVQGMVFSLSNVLIQSSVNSFGSAVMAGNTAASNIEGFVYTCMNAVSQTSMSFVSQNVGARRFGRVDKVVAQCMMLSTAVGVVLGGSAYLVGRWLLGIYTSDAQVVTYGLYRMSVICTTYFLGGWMDCMACTVRGLGFSLLPMVVSVLGACVLRIIWIATLFQWQPTQFCLYLSYPVSWGITAAAHLVCFFILRKKVRTQTPEEPAAAAA